MGIASRVLAGIGTTGSVDKARMGLTAEAASSPSYRAIFGRLSPLRILREHRPVLAGGSVAQQVQMLTSLYETASRVPMGLRLEETLRNVVGQAKALTGQGKAVLCMLDDNASLGGIDERSVFVRGPQSEYPESWWRTRIDRLAVDVLSSRLPKIALDEERQAWLLVAPVQASKKATGLLSAIRPQAQEFTDDQAAELAMLGLCAGTAIENTKVAAEAQYEALTTERSRIAKEMHDGLSPTLFAISLALERCKEQTGSRGELTQRLAHAQELASDGLIELRQYIHDLRPTSLQRLGLASAIDSQVRAVTYCDHVDGRSWVEGSSRTLPPAVEVCLLRVAQEAVTNIARHAGACSFSAILRFERNHVELLVWDDGRGFDVADALAKSEKGSSLGLKSMRERAESEGGALQVESRPGAGTRLTARIPYQRSHA